MTIQYKFNIKKMLETFIPLLKFIRNTKPKFNYGPFNVKELEEIGINFIGEASELTGVDEFMKKYLEDEKINYARNNYA